MPHSLLNFTFRLWIYRQSHLSFFLMQLCHSPGLPNVLHLLTLILQSHDRCYILQVPSIRGTGIGGYLLRAHGSSLFFRFGGAGLRSQLQKRSCKRRERQLIGDACRNCFPTIQPKAKIPFETPICQLCDRDSHPNLSILRLEAE